MTTRRRPDGGWLAVILVIGLFGAGLAFGAVYANAFGAGDKFERLVAKVERFIIGPPPPDRSAPPTVEVTPPPDPTPTPTPSLVSLAPGVTPAPTPTPIPRVAVDVSIVDDPEAVFAHEIRKDWCAPAGVQMVLATLGLADTSEAFQKKLAGRIHDWETYQDSHNYEWGPAAMALALEAYGAPG